MVSIIAKYESGWFQVRAESALWRDTLRAFDVDTLIMIPPLREKVWGSNPKLLQASSLEEALGLLDPSIPRIFVEPKYLDKGGIELRDFIHPKNAIYIFGNNCSGNKAYIKESDTVVSIDTPTPSEPWAPVIAGIVLYDRMIQWR